jgi:secreted PhoX family phosphatase
MPFGKRFLIGATVLCVTMLGGVLAVAQSEKDFGAYVEHLLEAHAEQLFGLKPLSQSALGPFTDLNSALAVDLAKGLKATVVSNATNQQNDMIALWPNDQNPTHLVVAIESGTSAPAVQVVDLRGNPNNNVKTILTGITSNDPIRRTPWGTIIVGEEATDGGLYEILDPININTPVQVTNRATGTTTDPTHVVKRKAIGSLAFEGIGILPNGVTYYGDELRPGNGNAGGAIYKFVPTLPFPGGPPITSLGSSPYADGKIYGMRLGTNSGNTDFGQGTEVGKGVWVLIDTVPDGNGNIPLRTGQAVKKLTGYYRPEDLEVDPIALANGIIRVCVANTGRMSNGGNSVVENAATYGEVICIVDEPNASATTGSRPFATRFFQGDRDANHFDNLAFQPYTGYLVVLEDGGTEVVTASGPTEQRGNDIWMLLPDGADRDVQSDGAVRILSVKDTDAEPTGFIFDASGETAYVHIQHRSTGLGAVLKITGFKVQ